MLRETKGARVGERERERERERDKEETERRGCDKEGGSDWQKRRRMKWQMQRDRQAKKKNQASKQMPGG